MSSHADGPDLGDVWVRLMLGWHLAFAAMVSAAAVYTVAATGLDAASRRRAALLLAVLVGVYVFGVVRARYRERRNWVYLVIAVVVVGLACAIDPAYTMLLFVVYPQIWMLTPSIRWALAACAALSVTAILGMGSATGWSEELRRDVLPQMAVALIFSVLLGWWITRVIEQSRQRAELIEELRRTRDELAAAHHEQGVTAERERMAREIHDTLAQGFLSIVTLAQAVQARMAKSLGQNGVGVVGSSSSSISSAAGELERIALIETVARENLADARALVAAFAPVDLDGVPLADAVRRVAERFAELTGTAVDVEVSGSLTGLGRTAEVVALRAVQEALANVRRHARASRVSVAVVADGPSARVEVTDDGVGFAPAEADGFGLAGMRDRVAAVGGQVEVVSEPGRGTRLVVRIPGEGR